MAHFLNSILNPRKQKSLVLIGIFALLCAGSAALTNPSQEVQASAPYSTYTAGPSGSLVATQTAYETENYLLPGLSSPEDLAYDEKNGVYLIADTGNARVLVLQEDGTLVTTLSDSLQTPYGVSFDQDHYYVADKTAQAVFRYDRSTSLLSATYARPTNALFGKKSPYVPLKVNVNSKGIFLVSEGSTKGIIQLDLDGNFVGYVGANATAKSFQSWFQSIFFSASQKASLLKAAPASPTNLSFSSSGLLYTVTNGDGSAAIKKLNTLGNVIMTPSYNLSTTLALTLDGEDNLFAVTSEGQILVYDGGGDLLFCFAKRSDYSERLGNMVSPKAIALKSDGTLIGLDGKTGTILTYQPTDFAKLVFQAIHYYNQGLYLEGESLWREVLAENSSFILSYRALAAADMKKGNYSLALREYELAEDRNGYSAAYWEIRNAWIQTYTGLIFGIILAVILVWIFVGDLYRRSVFLDKPALALTKAAQHPVVKIFSFQHTFMHTPEDAVYLIKSHQGGSLLGAIVLAVWFLVLQVLNPLITGYLFNSQNIYNTNLGQVILFTSIPLFLWILANYFVGNVTDGEGKLKDLFIGTIYAMSPYLLFALPIALLSRVLTYNESFVYYLLITVMDAWCAILLFKNFQEMHAYSFGKTIKNLLLTLVAFAATILVCYVLYMIAAQFFSYLGGVLREVFHHA